MVHSAREIHKQQLFFTRGLSAASSHRIHLPLKKLPHLQRFWTSLRRVSTWLQKELEGEPAQPAALDGEPEPVVEASDPRQRRSDCDITAKRLAITLSVHARHTISQLHFTRTNTII